MRSAHQSSKSARHFKRRTPGRWPAFRDVVVLDGAAHRVSAWRIGRDAAIVVRPSGALDAEGEIAIPLSAWAGFTYNPVRKWWERAS